MRGRASFLDIRHNGVRARNGAISVAFVPHDGDEPARVGYSISRRVGHAVVRNRLRRRLRAALSELARLNTPTLRGGLYVITPSPAAAGLSFTELRDALAAALEKSALLAHRPGSAP
jgi:ribonuclease P protein component